MMRILLRHLVLLFAAPALAQVSLTSADIDPLLFGPTGFLRASLHNAGEAEVIILSGEVRSAEEGVVLTFRSAPYMLASGISQVRASMLGFQEFVHGAGPRGRAAAIAHRLPAGSYSHCVQIESVGSCEVADRLCDVFAAEDLLVMDLVHPADGDTIDSRTPTLTWTITGATVPPGQIARAILVPMGVGMDAYQSITAELPVFVADHLLHLAIPYPVGVPGLEAGRCYAWQVERFLEGTSIDRTEAWRFCVRDRKPKRADRYVLLGRHITETTVEPVDGRICFRLDDAYAGDVPTCHVLNDKGEVLGLSGAALAERKEWVLDARGPGLYELDLEQHGLGIGSYTLVVTDGKQRSYRLAFKYQ